MLNEVLKDKKNIFLIGIGGSSMSSLAIILKSMGYLVSGSDKTQSDFTRLVEDNGIKVYYEGVPSELKNSDLVCYTSSVTLDENYIYASMNGKLLISRSKMLGLVSNAFDRVLAVAGSHGKTTTSSMLAFILDRKKSGVNSHIGGILVDKNTNTITNIDRKYFVSECCEYNRSFLSVRPKGSIILNIDLDHVDYYKDINDLKDAFLEFSENTLEYLIVNYEDENSRFLLENSKSISFGLSSKADCYAFNIKECREYTIFDIFYKGIILHNVRIKMYGVHNVLNTLAVYLMCEKEGVSSKEFIDSVCLFNGVKRRYEKFTLNDEVDIVFDYAHHPREIEKVIATTLNRKPNNLYVVFQPHTYTRTKYFLKEFQKVFKGAKEVILMPIYAAREINEDNISIFDLAKDIAEKVNVIEDRENVISYIDKIVKKGDIVLFLGAGDIYLLSKEFDKKA